VVNVITDLKLRVISLTLSESIVRVMLVLANTANELWFYRKLSVSIKFYVGLRNTLDCWGSGITV